MKEIFKIVFLVGVGLSLSLLVYTVFGVENAIKFFMAYLMCVIWFLFFILALLTERRKHVTFFFNGAMEMMFLVTQADVLLRGTTAEVALEPRDRLFKPAIDLVPRLMTFPHILKPLTIESVFGGTTIFTVRGPHAKSTKK